MSNQVNPYVFNPANLPEEPYLKIAHYLDKHGLSQLSLLSRQNYIAIYKTAIGALLMRYQVELPSRLLTFLERTLPHCNKPHLLSNHDDQILLQKRAKIISFASAPQHRRFRTILNRAFPERLTYAEEIERERAPLGQNYQTWMREEIFVGSIGLEVPVFLLNLRRLIERYQGDPNPSILQMLRNAQAVFPSEKLTQAINLIEANPQIQIFTHPSFRTFTEDLESTLNAEQIVLKIKDIADEMTTRAKIFSLLGERHAILIMNGWMFALEAILPSLHFLVNLPPELVAEHWGLSHSESHEFREMLTLSLSYHALYERAHSQGEYDAEVIFAGVDIPAYMNQLDHLRAILQKGSEAQAATLIKRNQHTSLLWQVIYSDDRESFACLMNSPAFYFFMWNQVLTHLLTDGQFDLFLHLISYPQISDSLLPEELTSLIHTFLTKGGFTLNRHPSSVLLPFFRSSSAIRTLDNSNHFEELTRPLLPSFLGEGEISPHQWTHLCLLNQKRNPSSKIFGITLNALARAKKTDLVKQFLALPHLHQDIPATSSLSNPLILFFRSYPLLWNRLCSHPEEGALLFAQMLRDLSSINLFRSLGPERCAEIFQFLLSHPDMVQAISELEETKVSVTLSKFYTYCSLDRLDSQEAIQHALQQALRLQHPEFRESLLHTFQPTLTALAGILFAHDRYLLKLFVQMTQKEDHYASEFKNLLKLVNHGAPLLTLLATPAEHKGPEEIPYKTLDLLSTMGCYLWGYNDQIPTVGWDTIFQTAASHPPLLNILASAPTVAVHMPQNLRNAHLPLELQVYAADFQAFATPQEGSTLSAAEHLGRLLEVYPLLIKNGLKALQENCSFLRRIALTFRLPKFLSSTRYHEFYTDLPLFYRIIGQIGKLWARLLG